MREELEGNYNISMWCSVRAIIVETKPDDYLFRAIEWFQIGWCGDGDGDGDADGDVVMVGARELCSKCSFHFTASISPLTDLLFHREIQPAIFIFSDLYRQLHTHTHKYHFERRIFLDHLNIFGPLEYFWTTWMPFLSSDFSLSVFLKWNLRESTPTFWICIDFRTNWKQVKIKHCTMGPAMEIDILEVRKGKKYYALIFNPKMSIPFVNGVKLPKFWLCIKISIFLCIFAGLLWKKL